ncbi:MAG: glycoside hydrolase family 15 protein [Acidimicrobiales bacterium]
MRIEDYALIGDLHTAALVGRTGSIDWLCLPRFDSPACFAALLGTEDHGHWTLAAEQAIGTPSRRYRPDSLILETEWTTPGGRVRVVDFMPPREDDHTRVVRLVEGLEGTVRMAVKLVLRFEYGTDTPWVFKTATGLRALAGPNEVALDTPAPLHGHEMHTDSTFDISAGERIPFVLTWHPAHGEAPEASVAEEDLTATEAFWQRWCAGITDVHGQWQDQVRRSLITLKALIYDPTGGIVAAATTSLPEQPGGVRNWDYRYCWVRDATLTLDALIEAGCRDEAQAWMLWLGRAVAGAPDELQIMYGPAGERWLPEVELEWLPGYEQSRPVRVGNAASGQFQLDVYGELMDATDRARNHGIALHPLLWDLQRTLLDFVAGHWQDPDEGIWEIRGPRRQFTHSRVMAWVAMDRAVSAVEVHGLDGPLDEWKKVRQAIHDEVCARGWNPERRAFTQYYGADDLDASILMIPLVGFLPASDGRVVATVEAIERELLCDGFVRRYQNESGVDGLPGTEGVFLPCSFWLADCLAAIGRLDDAVAMFTRLLAVVNDVGLLSEEYDPTARRQLGNIPQAFSHVGLINTARNLTAAQEVVRRSPG